MSCIHYKFRSSLEYDTITFDGLAISLGDLKKAIMAQKKVAKVTDFDLQVTNAQTKEEYKDENTQIPKNSSVIIRRIPTGTRSKAQLAADRGDTYASGIPIKTKTEELHTASMKQNKMIDLVNSDASEEDKLKVMMSQAGEDWQPTHYVKGRGRGYNPSGPLPPNYVCYRCGKPGHFIRNCPTNGIKRTIGIPRKFGEEAQAEPTDSGEKETKKPESTKILVPVPETNTTKDRKMPSELKCPMCQNLLHDAVLIPCCGTSYCDECIRTYLLENEQECPTCGAEDVSPDSLIINKQLRQAVNNFRNARPASPFVNSTTDKTSTGNTDIDKPAVNSIENLTQSVTDKPTSSSPHINVAASDIRSPDTSEKDKLEEKVTSTTSEAPDKNITELKKEELKKEGSPVVFKGDVSSPTPAPSSDAEDSATKPTQGQPGGDHLAPLPGYGKHPTHRPPGPNMMHPISESLIPRSIAPDGAIVVPAIRAARPILTPMHSAPIIQPGFITTTAPMGLRPMVHPGIVHPAMHMEPNMMGAGFPFGMKHGGLNPYGDGPPMSEEEFYRYQKKMKLRTKRKHRDKDRLRERDRGSRERSQERLRDRDKYKPKMHPADFDDELSQYRAIQRHRSKNYGSRSRSRSQSRSYSRSLSQSLSHSSRSRSKSPTPEDWDRSRTPSPSSQPAASDNKSTTEDDKKHKHKKRKKHHKHKHSKKRKTDDNVDRDSTTKGEISGTDKAEKKKSKSKKKSKEKSEKSDKKAKLNNGTGDKGSNMDEDKREEPMQEEKIDRNKKAQQKESDHAKVEDKEKSDESEKLSESGQNGTEHATKKTKKKSEEKSKRKLKEKSSDKKHKKKKKRKHKKHKKEKEKATSQSTEEKSVDSTEETQDSDEDKDEQ